MEIKKIFLLVVFVFMGFQVFATENHIDIFLTNYFENLNYKLEEFSNGTDLIYFAFYSRDNNDMFQKAIIFKSKGKSIYPLLFFTKNEIYNLDKRLVAPIIKTQEFYGWKVTIEKTSVLASFYSDGGRFVADTIRLIYKYDKFEIATINKADL